MSPIIFYTKPQIAEAVGMSERNFQRTIKEMNYTLEGHYFTEKCVEKVKQAIEEFMLTKVKKNLPPPQVTKFSYVFN